ncbi:MAG: hypothetical protein ACPHK8_07050, partial [Thermoplasmatota archaeon]
SFDGLIHAADGSVATYARTIHDLSFEGQLFVATASGWVGALAWGDPVVLITRPQDRFAVTSIPTVEVAYAKPSGSGVVPISIEARSTGDWQTLATLEGPLDSLTNLASVPVDLRGFPNGALIQFRATVDGATHELGNPVMVDHEPPHVVGSHTPQEGVVFAGTAANIGWGFRDEHSGIAPSTHRLTLDGVLVPSVAELSFSRTRVDGLTEGKHHWVASIEDQAGNKLTETGSFTVNLQAPSLQSFQWIANQPDQAVIQFTTTEPATCTSSDADVTSTVDQHLYERIVSPGTDYAATVTCDDGAGKSKTFAVANWKSPTVDTRLHGVTMQLEGPKTNGWFTATPTLNASLGDVRMSIDGGPFQAGADIPPGTHVLRAYAEENGKTSQLFTFDYQLDLDTPTLAGLQWLPELGIVRWSDIQEEHGHIESLRVEVLAGEWVAQAELPTTSTRFEELPSGITQFRLVLEDAAGHTWTSPEYSVGQTGVSLQTTAALRGTQLLQGENTEIQVRLAHETIVEGRWVDPEGRINSFTDRTRIDGPVWLVRGSTAQLAEGSYQVQLVLSDGVGQRTLNVGSIQVSTTQVTNESSGSASDVATRETPPAPLPLLLLAGLARKRFFSNREDGA